MATKKLTVTLMGYYSDGRNVTADEFVRPLADG